MIGILAIFRMVLSIISVDVLAVFFVINAHAYAAVFADCILYILFSYFVEVRIIRVIASVDIGFFDNISVQRIRAERACDHHHIASEICLQT